MKLYVDLETLQLIEGPGFRNPVTSLRFKRGDAALLEVTFLTDGITAASIGDPASLELQFGIKPRNRYDVGYLVQNSAWTMPAVDAETPIYQCFPSFNTEELDSALGVGSSTGTELPELTLMGEITWREGTGEPTSTRTFLVVVENDVNRGTEGTPVKLPTPDDWLAAKQTPTPVATNTAKKALTGVPAGAIYVITGEANRIERYVGDLNGSAEANDDNWIIIGPNTIRIVIKNNKVSGAYVIGGFAIPAGYLSTDIGWWNPELPIPISVNGSSPPYTGGVSYIDAEYVGSSGRTLGDQLRVMPYYFGSYSPNSLWFSEPFPPRASVVFDINS